MRKMVELDNRNEFIDTFELNKNILHSKFIKTIDFYNNSEILDGETFIYSPLNEERIKIDGKIYKRVILNNEIKLKEVKNVY